MKKNIADWLDKVAKEAYDLGVDYFIAVGEDNFGKAEVRANYVIGNSNIVDISTYWAAMTRPFAARTFKDFYEYIQKIERNEFGYAFPFKGNKNIALHIYEGKRQVNINKKDDNGNYMSILNIIYDPEEGIATLINVSKNGVAEYNNPVVVDINSPLYNADAHVEFDNYLEAISIIKDAIGSRG